MDARHLETFHGVLRHGSLLATARAMGCAQSTITVRVQELERELGVRLFARKGRQLVLTEAGRAVSERTAEISTAIAGLKEMAATFDAGVAGRVRIGAIEPSASHRLPAVLAPFCARRPSVQLTVEVAGTDRVARLVADGDLDFALASPPPTEHALEFEFLFDERMSLLIPARHPLAALRRVTAHDLSEHPIILTDQSCAYRQVIESALRRVGVTVRHHLEIASIEAVRRLVMQGVGVGFVPVRGTDAPPEKAVLRSLYGVPLTLPIGLVTRRSAHRLTPAQEAVKATFRDRMRRA